MSKRKFLIIWAPSVLVFNTAGVAFGWRGLAAVFVGYWTGVLCTCLAMWTR